MPGHVRGSFFAEYVRMLRRQKDADWSKVLPPEDMVYLVGRVNENEWYPMETFERMGLAILSNIEGASLDAVRMWGRFSASLYSSQHPDLIALGEPAETLMRLKVLRGTLFDFPAFDVPMLTDCHAYVVVSYGMCDAAEEAACIQTQGFCEGVLARAGATDIRAEFEERSWNGDARTRLSIEWEVPSVLTPR